MKANYLNAVQKNQGGGLESGQTKERQCRDDAEFLVNFNGKVFNFQMICDLPHVIK